MGKLTKTPAISLEDHEEGTSARIASPGAMSIDFANLMTQVSGFSLTVNLSKAACRFPFFTKIDASHLTIRVTPFTVLIG
jgi:hypothetical protein